jgi:uncharacterized membrane protein YeaQ/YmgE (transglycosylase-associated protein family)
VCLIIAVLIAGILFLGGLFATVGFVLAFLPWLFVGLIVGAIASAITESRHGVLGDIVIGLAGSVIGGTLIALLLHERAPRLISLEGIVAAIVGAVILLVFVKVLNGTA